MLYLGLFFLSYAVSFVAARELMTSRLEDLIDGIHRFVAHKDRDDYLLEVREATRESIIKGCLVFGTMIGAIASAIAWAILN